jgi:MFS family permease
LLSYIGDCAGKEWGLTSSQQANISSFVFVGELCGSFIWGNLSDRYGRKITFTAGCLLITIAGLLSAISSSYTWLVFFRFLVGFGVGCVTVPFDILAEFLPISRRGEYLLYIEYYWCFGTLIVNAVAWVTLSRYGWRFLIYTTAVPVTVTVFASIVLLPESPRWLVSKGRKKDAENIIRKHLPEHRFLMNIPSSNHHHHHQQQHVSLKEDESKLHVRTCGCFDLLRAHNMRKLTLSLLIIWFSFGFAYFAMLLQLTKIYSSTTATGSSSVKSESKTCSFDYESLFINSAAEFAGIFVATQIIDRLGRVRSQVVMYVIAGVMLLFMGWNIAPIGYLIALWIGRAALIGASCITWVATPELFPTGSSFCECTSVDYAKLMVADLELRGTGHGLCNAFARIGAFFSPYFILSSLDDSMISLGVCGICLLAGGAAYTLPETTGQHLYELHTKRRG